MSKKDAETTIQELKDLIARFNAERGWGKHHTPKNLAMSIAIEAAELMEHFQWDEHGERDKAEIENELADVMMYVMNFAHTLDIDVATAYRRKLVKAAEKYPTELFNQERDRVEDYVRIKKAYRAGQK